TSAQLLYGASGAWESWRRSVDFYDESVLIWLEVDTLIRQQTNGTKSLDDFCKRFHGGQSGKPAVVPYSFEDVVAGLNAVSPFDWHTFLRTRLDAVGNHAPLGGIENSGWKLTYNETMSHYQEVREKVRKSTDEWESIGAIFRAKRDDIVIIVDEGV